LGYFNKAHLKENDLAIVSNVTLLNLVHTGNLQFLAIFCNFSANGDGFLPKTSKLE